MNIECYDNRWCAVQVKPRQEMMVSSVLRVKGYEEFSPTYRLERQWCDRRKETLTPLFPGYVFCRLNSRIPWPIITTAGVIRIVSNNTRDIAVIDDQEIESIRLVVKTGIKMEPCLFASIGDRVRITSGPLTRLEGIVTGHKNHQRLVLSIELIHSSVSVEVDGYNIVLVSNAPVPQLANSSPISRSAIAGGFNRTALAS